MKSFSLKKLIKYFLLLCLLYFVARFSIEAFRVLAYNNDREQLLSENKTHAKKLLKSFGAHNLPFDNALPEEQQLDLLFSLMLLEKNPEGLSQLDMLYRAYDLPLLFIADARFPEEYNLFDLYKNYRNRLAAIGEASAYIEREDIVAKPQGAYSPQTVQQVLVLSDFQMRDEESPFLLYPLKPYFPTSYYPANPYVPYIVEDAIKTFRAYEQSQQLNIDLAIFTGDMTDNGHYNEVRWGIEALDGGLLNPDSGLDDDIFVGRYANDEANGGEPNDSSDAFIATGLANTPWYFVPGNHDGLAMGVFAMTYQPINLFFTQLQNGTFGFMNAMSVGDTNYLGTIPNIRSMLNYWWSEKPFDKVAPDKNRRLLNPVDIAQEMFITQGLPVGHGMAHSIDLKHDRSYSFVTPSKNGSFDIRHITLDTNASHLQGEFPDNKMQWLSAELEDALSKKQLVIVSSHHKPVDIFDNGNDLVALLNSYPNVIAHLVAHWHRNGMEARIGSSPENGYWQIETDSMVNWPQQIRILDIAIDQSSGIGHIKTTMINHHNANPYAVSERGRFLAYLEAFLIGGDEKLLSREGLPNTRNTVLYFQLPPSFFHQS